MTHIKLTKGNFICPLVYNCVKNELKKLVHRYFRQVILSTALKSYGNVEYMYMKTQLHNIQRLTT